MMAAALAKGRTTLENCACEPEVEELARVLNKMGARIHGAGTSLITIEGVDELHPVEHAIIPDRIEAGTLMVAAALTRGNVLLRDCLPEHLEAVIGKLRAAGVEITVEAGGRARARAGGDPAGRRGHPALPRLSHRHAGAVHGADDPGPGAVGADRDHLREPLHARARADAAWGRTSSSRGAPRSCAGPTRLQGRQGDGHRPARLGLAGAGRPGGRRDRRRSCASTTWTAATNAWTRSCAALGADIRRARGGP